MIENQRTDKETEPRAAGKAMYKISKINTIFIIDMLQNKSPLATASVHGKVSIWMETILFLIRRIRNKTFFLSLNI